MLLLLRLLICHYGRVEGDCEPSLPGEMDGQKERDDLCGRLLQSLIAIALTSRHIHSHRPRTDRQRLFIDLCIIDLFVQVQTIQNSRFARSLFFSHRSRDIDYCVYFCHSVARTTYL